MAMEFWDLTALISRVGAWGGSYVDLVLSFDLFLWTRSSPLTCGPPEQTPSCLSQNRLEKAIADFYKENANLQISLTTSPKFICNACLRSSAP